MAAAGSPAAAALCAAGDCADGGCAASVSAATLLFTAAAAVEALILNTVSGLELPKKGSQIVL